MNLFEIGAPKVSERERERYFFGTMKLLFFWVQTKIVFNHFEKSFSATMFNKIVFENADGAQTKHKILH